MVYSTPATDAAPVFRPQHRRTRSSTATFSSERGDGAFASLGALPRRKAAPAKKFHFRSSEEDEDDDDDDAIPPPLDAVTRKGGPALNSLGLSVDTANLAPRRPSPQPQPLLVPFPRSSPRNSPYGPPSPRPFSPRPSLMHRTPSSPVILLSNGKPLKSSLKSSTSSPNIPALHIRTQSAPSTPSVKSVHFGDEDDDEENADAKRPIEHVRVFKSSGKPASLLSFKPGEDTETETEAESSGYPFPTMPPLSPASPSTSQPHSHWEIDASPAVTSPIPRPSPSPYANIHLETVTLPRTRPYTLRGSVLVRNLSFEKAVAVRFTLDDWQTTSEVTCKHVVSLPSIPPPFPRTRTVGDAVGIIAHASSQAGDDMPPPDGRPQWDRFSFVIRLEDYEHRLNERTLYMVGRYTAPGVGEWWDNNDGKNYRVGFRKVVDAPAVKTPESPVLSSSQQGSFRAPSTLRTTPVTGQVRTDEKPSPPASRGVSVSLDSVPAVKPAALVRTNSGPPSVLPGMLPYTPPPPPPPQRRGGGSMKLKLTNYAAPSVPSVGMQPAGPLSPIGGNGSGIFSPVGFGSPPKVASPKEQEQECEQRIEDVEREWKEAFYWDGRYMREDEDEKKEAAEEPEHHEKVEVKMVGEIVGGQFVTTVVPVQKEKDEAPTPSMSSAESSPPDSGVVTPVHGEDAAESAGSGATTPRGASTKDSSYAAFVRQFCFAQSPLGGPASAASTPTPTNVNNSGWLGLEGYGFGFGGTDVGFGFGMGRRLGEGGMGVGSA
ncbi:hypothetical protein GLOTRDRAFT_134851 [Gloeophyllum trabeum ATCC 11539]|uniref:CBM21 domain-containing protein n=1 Tax=Gloeophyllum trabeum (strain ATCC 11539 / FP-39264 / Madison 617) TaxID=670483 RepID=S7RYS2_GLOTA|nr:uncharacterized protein GLOTRDRAFT_134851 [Gloeophyllum trabeum ATCC 11539]EPQ60100.1 hypothetical protein GLOTRDRAFT_134851 [Gloeophyllum trabeum ATCC 11539]